MHAAYVHSSVIAHLIMCIERSYSRYLLYFVATDGIGEHLGGVAV
jgi:hypothetical protein